MEAGYAALDAKVTVVVHAELLTGQFLKTIRVLRLQEHNGTQCRQAAEKCLALYQADKQAAVTADSFLQVGL